MAPPLKKLAGADVQTRALEQNVDEALRPLREHPFADGELLAGANGAPVLLLAGKANRIDHALNRKARWLLVSPQANAAVWEDPADEVLPERILTLRTSVDLSTYLFVFPV